jgi:hypothetical protein
MEIVALDFRCAKSWKFLNGLSNDASLSEANQNITDYCGHLYLIHLSESLQHVWHPYKDSTGYTLPDFTGDRRALWLSEGKVYHIICIWFLSTNHFLIKEILCIISFRDKNVH